MKISNYGVNNKVQWATVMRASMLLLFQYFTEKIAAVRKIEKPVMVWIGIAPLLYLTLL